MGNPLQQKTKLTVSPMMIDSDGCLTRVEISESIPLSQTSHYVEELVQEYNNPPTTPYIDEEKRRNNQPTTK